MEFQHNMKHTIPKHAGGFPSKLSILFALFTISVGGLVVNRRSQMLTAIPTVIDPDVTILFLQNNAITRVDDGDLASLIWLEFINLDLNPISFISTRAFINNTRLTRIGLYENMLPAFPTGFGGSRPYVVHIKFKGRIPMKTVSLSYFPVLEHFNINDNEIDSLAIGDAPSLKELFAVRCGINTFPDLSMAPKLEEVFLSDNNFSHVSQSSIMGLTRLRNFAVNSCGVRYLPDLSHLVSLEKFEARNNYISVISDLYHAPLTKFHLINNPMLCNKRLCWIRMWNSIKPTIGMSEITCAHPSIYMGTSLMNIHPTDMHLYEGTQFHQFPYTHITVNFFALHSKLLSGIN